MRSTILAITAALALGISSSAMANGGNYSESGGELVQGSTVHAGSISGATTIGTGFAGTYGISNMSAGTSGKLRSNDSRILIQGTSYVQGHSESGTLVEGSGMAGSIAGGSADSGFGGEGYFGDDNQSGDAWALGGSTGESWAASGSIGTGGGLSVQGFEAYGEAKAKAKSSYEGGGQYDIDTKVWTSSGALSYTIEEGSAIGQTHAVGWGFAGADAWRVHGDSEGGGDCVAHGGEGNCGVGAGLGGGNGTGNEGGGNDD